MRAITLILVAAVLHMVDGCNLICNCFPFRSIITSRAFEISENTYAYNVKFMLAANCTDRNLTDVPFGLHDDISSVSLDLNSITHLTNSIFANKGLHKLSALYLNNNSISVVEEKAFLGLADLQTLVLDGNKITTLPVKVFEPCEHLSYISMRGNNLILPDYIFEGKTNKLQTLMMSHCSLKTLPKDMAIIELSDLDISYNELGNGVVINFTVQSLKISNNNIIDLSKAETNISSQKILDLSGNTLIFKPEKRLKAPKLEILMLTSCNLTDDYEHLIQETTELKILELSKNNIHEIKSSVMTSLVNLEGLFIQHNKIKFLDSNSLTANSRLIKINVSENPLDFPQDGVFLNSSSLKFLYVSHCNITRITDKSFQYTPSLQVLDLRSNRIENIDDYFHHMVLLERLFLDGNRIKTVNSESFVNNIHLIELTLSNNPIKIPVIEPFLHAPSLNVLALNFCNITYVPLNTFKNTPYLASLSIRNNSIQAVEVSVFQNIKRLEQLDMEGNPLLCDSRLKQVLSWCLKHEIRGHATCTAPKGDWRMLEHLHFEDNFDPLPDVSSVTEKHEVKKIKQDPTSTRPSSATMFLLLGTGLIVGAMVGMVLEVFISRRYRCFSTGETSSP